MPCTAYKYVESGKCVCGKPADYELSASVGKHDFLVLLEFCTEHYQEYKGKSEKMEEK